MSCDCCKGACCDGVTCTWVTKAECAAAGGSWQGVGTTCSPNNPCCDLACPCAGYFGATVNGQVLGSETVVDGSFTPCATSADGTQEKRTYAAIDTGAAYPYQYQYEWQTCSGGTLTDSGFYTWGFSAPYHDALTCDWYVDVFVTTSSGAYTWTSAPVNGSPCPGSVTLGDPDAGGSGDLPSQPSFEFTDCIEVGGMAVGPGSMLKAMLTRFGLQATPDCKCNQMAQKMNAWGPEECKKRVEEIVDVMEAEAKKRGLPFLRAAGRVLVRRAISRSRRKGNSQ